MTLPALSPEARTAAFYSTVFMVSGAMTVYGGIWMSGLGLTDGQIGIVNAAPVLAMLVLNIVVGRIADRASDWRQVIVLGTVGAGILPVGLLWADGFWGVLIFWTLGTICAAAAIPVLDAAATRLTARRGTDFGAMRAWGTIGYLVVLLGTGIMVGQDWGPAAFIWLVVGLGLLRAAVSLGLPRFRAEPSETRVRQGAGRLSEVMRPWFLLPLVGWAMISATHLILAAFQGLLFERQGIGTEWIGAVIALGALSETAMFFAFRRWFGRFRPRSLILASALVSAARWAVMGLEPGLGGLIALQALHGITYGLGFMACLAFITKWTSEDIAAEAQGFFVVLQQAMSVVTLYGFGLLAAQMGAQAYFVSAGFAAVGAGMIWLSLRMGTPKAG
jgi:PPP family 3-phenylpropionic acid transporter